MSKQQSEQLRDILCDFMGQIEEVGSEIVGAPTTKDMLKVDAVYGNAIARHALNYPTREGAVMEGYQYINHRVIDGMYQAILYWKVENGVVYIREGEEWRPTEVGIRFIKDFELPKEDTPNEQ